jgi:hypothetical protein
MPATCLIQADFVGPADMAILPASFCVVKKRSGEKALGWPTKLAGFDLEISDSISLRFW